MILSKVEHAHYTTEIKTKKEIAMRNALFFTVVVLLLSGCAGNSMQVLTERVDKLETGQSSLFQRTDLLDVKTVALEEKLNALGKTILLDLRKKYKKYKEENDRDPKISFVSDFDLGEFNLTDKMKAQIEAYHVYLIQKTKEKESTNLKIKGWADSNGASKLNQTLSEKRAETVLIYLDSLMTDAERKIINIDAIGMGENKGKGGEYRYVTFEIT